MASKLRCILNTSMQFSSNGSSTLKNQRCYINTSSSFRSLLNASELHLPVSELPSKAKVVICGGGAQGAAIAYELAQRGWGSDTVLIEQAELGGGSTWHSSGLITVMRDTPIESKLSKLSKELYQSIEEQGYYTGWHQNGSLFVARTLERFHYFQRLKAVSVARDIECELVDREKIEQICPIIRVDDLKGGLWVPGDGVVDTFEVCLALVNLAINKGVTIVQRCQLQEILQVDGSVSEVRTNRGSIQCEHFVNSAGIWARNVGILSNPRVGVPLHPVDHYFLHTKPVLNLPVDTPSVRDPDGHIYFRENEGRFLAGGYVPKAKPAFVDGVLPTTSFFHVELPVDWDLFHVLLENLLHRVPIFKTAIFEKLINGPESFSPDGKWILGQAPEIRNYYVAGAISSIGASAYGGVAKVISDLICNRSRSSAFDIYSLDVQRFLAMHNNRKFLLDRVKEVPGLIYSIPFPFKEVKTGRALRTSPIFPRMRDAGARFSQVMGYERAMYFKKPSQEMNFTGLDAPENKVGADSEGCSLTIAHNETFYKPTWFNVVKEEFTASREAVSICDYSSFAKMEISSSGNSDVVQFLQYMCSNNVDVPIGNIIHTGMQNENGGYENDCSVARLAVNRYMLMSPSIQQMRSYTWMKHRLPRDGSVDLQDVTSLYTTLCVMGPYSRTLLAKLTPTPLSSKVFPFFTCRYIDVGCAPGILTMNLTHTGELGYVFYIPNEFALHVYDAILDAGAEFGIKQCGYYAMRAVRIEKFFAFWGQDLDSQSTPLECGRLFRTKIGQNDMGFVGKRALQEQLENGIRKIMVMLLLDDSTFDVDKDPWPWGGEPIYRNDRLVGTVTTTSFGFSLNKMIALGFIRKSVEEISENSDSLVTPSWVKEGEYSIDIAGHRFPAKVRLNPPVLPKRISAETHLYEAIRHEI